MEFELIIKKINGALSGEESVLFDKWYDESQEHRDYFHKVEKNYLQGPGKIDKQKGWLKIENRLRFAPRPSLKLSPSAKAFGQSTRRARKNFWKYGVAASVLLLIAVVIFLNPTSGNEESDMVENSAEVVASPIQIGSPRAILTLEDGSDIALEKGNILNRENLSSDGEELVYLKGFEGEISSEKKIRYNTLTIPRGGEFYLQLSDGTKVWLNSDSRIRYPVTFDTDHSRKVELIYGEAYFDVSDAENHGGTSFEVISKGQEITVLGTQFNVKAYADEEEIYSTLVEGSIALVYNEKNQLLKPNDQAIVSKGRSDIEVRSIDVYNEVAWRMGVFGFERETLAEIMKVLSRWYDVEVIFETQSIEDLRFTGALRKKQKIENILTIISKSNGIEYEINDKTVVLK